MAIEWNSFIFTLLLLVMCHHLQHAEGADKDFLRAIEKLKDVKNRAEDIRNEQQSTCARNVGELDDLIQDITLLLGGLQKLPNVTCPVLKEWEAPTNGGLVCYNKPGRNFHYCSALCNNGYEFPVRLNAFESCSPWTSMQWSFRRHNKQAIFPPCIEEFFPDLKTQPKDSYFDDLCVRATPQEQLRHKRNFLNTLNNSGKCEDGCDITHFTILCGNLPE